MEMHDLKIEYVPVESVHQHPDNANSSDMNALEESIRENGFYSPIIVQRSTGHILAGNHRWLALLRDHAEQAPVVYLDVDDVRARKIMLADNRTTRLGHDDEGLVYELLNEIALGGGDIRGTGYDMDDYARLRALIDEPMGDLEIVVEEAMPLIPGAYEVTPVSGYDDRCFEIAISKTDGSHLTLGDLNKVRKALGLPREDAQDAEKYGIPAWSRRF